MKTLTLIAIASVLGAGSALAQPSSPTYTPNDFHDVPSLEGQGWTVSRYGDDFAEGGWGARFEAGGKALYKIDKAGRESWVQFLLWPTESEPKLLFVMRFTGGAHGPMLLDAVHLTEGYPRVLRADIDRFDWKDGEWSKIVDLDDDGWPEVQGYTTSFDYFMTMPIGVSGAESPGPRVILGYDAKSAQYRTMSFKFPEMMQPPIDKAREAFMTWRGSNDPVPAEVVLEGWPRKTNAPAETVQAYKDLCYWAIHTVYAGRADEAWGILEEHADPVLAKITRQAVEREIGRDYWYYNMVELMKEREKGSP